MLIIIFKCSAIDAFSSEDDVGLCAVLNLLWLFDLHYYFKHLECVVMSQPLQFHREPLEGLELYCE